MSWGGGSARNVMWASCLCAIVIALQYRADAAPVLASSLGYCQKVPILKDPNSPLDCCLPAPKTEAVPFKLPVNPVLRERKPAHVLSKDPEYVRKYNEAYAKMRALPADDPRSWAVQWKTHCSFCNEAFLQKSIDPNEQVKEIPLQVHYSWTFLPWHRMLIYFHERILGSLINDPTFALPFWNWDNQLEEGANQIPSMFIEGFAIANPALISQNRNRKHFPPLILPLSYDSKLEAEGGQNMTNEQIKADNLCVVYNQVVNKVSAREFLGGPYRIGTDNSVSSVPKGVTPGESGGAENLHNTAHEWVGLINDPNFPDNEDMGNFIYAGKDPIFYSHHANVDRLWDLWKTLPDKVTPGGHRKRQEYKEPDFLDTEFSFYDENAQLVIVKQRDTLDSAKLGYKYTDMSASDKLWIEHKPQVSKAQKFKVAKSNFKTSAESWTPSDFPEVDPNANNTIGDTATCFKVSRRAPTKEDLKGKQVKHKRQLSEGVVMENVKIPHSCYVRFDVFVDFPTANRVTDLDKSDYVGTFTHLPSGLVNTTTSVSQEKKSETEKFRLVNIWFSTGLALRRLGITDPETDITVTVVPKMRLNGETVLTFSNLRQDFQ